MGVVIISTLQRGAAGTAPFPISIQDDLKIAYLTVADTTARDAIPEWKRTARMLVYVIGENTSYRLGTDITIAGQVWTEEETSGAFQLLVEKNQPSGYVGLNADGYIDPQFIRSILVTDVYVVDTQAEMFALTTKTGDIVHVTADPTPANNGVYIKVNNDPAPTDINDFSKVETGDAVTSVNGMVGAVEITINNLLAYGGNQNEFDTAVANTPAVLNNTAAIAVNQDHINTIYALLAGLGVETDIQIPLYDNVAAYDVGDNVLYDPGTGRMNLYRCRIATPGSIAPDDVTYWDRIGDFYTQDEVDAMLALKADLVNGKVPESQLPDTINALYIVADINARNALVNKYKGMRVFVVDATTDTQIEQGSAEYVYDLTSPVVDPEGWTLISNLNGSNPFDWNRPIATLPAVGQNLRQSSVDAGLEKMYFGPVDPEIIIDPLDYQTAGATVAATLTGRVIPNGATAINSIKVIRVSDSFEEADILAQIPPTPTEISTLLDPQPIILGSTEQYKITVQAVIDGDTVDFESDIVDLNGVYPIIYGFGAPGLTGTDLYNLTKVEDINNAQYLNVSGSNNRFYFGFPDDYDDLHVVYDQNRNELLDALFPASPDIRQVDSSGLAADWMKDYKIYESEYNITVDGNEWRFLWEAERAGTQTDASSLFTQADQDKLDSIEAGAQVNPTAAQIKTLYESNPDTEVFTTANKTKLQGIEEGAQVNPTAPQIKTLYESNADTNAFTDDYQQQLDDLEADPPGDMLKSEYASALPSSDFGIVGKALEQAVVAFNPTGATIPIGRYVKVTSVDLVQGLAFIALADRDNNDIVDAFANENIAPASTGIIVFNGLNTFVDTTGRSINDPVFLGQNGTVVYDEPPASGSAVHVGTVYAVGNPGLILSTGFTNLLTGSYQLDWRPNTFYPKWTKIAAYSPIEPELGAFLLRTKKDLTSDSVFDPAAPLFDDDYEILGGDMKTGMYDPQNVNADTFDMDNMIDGMDADPAIKKVAMTENERTKLAGLEDPTFKGYFNKPSDLNATYPVGQVGWSAIVVFEEDGTTPNGNLWNWIGTPTDAWVDSGISGIGGDMNKSTYDPTNVSGDAFLMDNFLEGSDVNKRFFDDARKAKLDAFDSASNYYTVPQVDAALLLKADKTYVDTQDGLKMDISVYDPGAKATDAFSMDNMDETATAKVLTDVERTNITNAETDRHTHANKAILDGIIDTGDGSKALVDDGTYNDVADGDIHGGTCLEQQDFFVVPDSNNIYVDVEKKGGGDLPVWINGEIKILDCTGGAGVNGRARIQITEGAADDAEVNSILIIDNAGTLELNATIGSPTGVYAWVGVVGVLDYATTLTEGPFLTQRFTDAPFHNDRGRLSHLGERHRVNGAKWWTGVDPTVTIIPNAGARDTIQVTLTAGEVYQLHKQSFPVYDSVTDGVFIGRVSGNGTLQSYQKIPNVNMALEYYDGTAVQDGDYFNMVIWGVINKETADCKVFVNVSAAGYVRAGSCYNDGDNLANYSVGTDYRTVGFLITRIPLRYTAVDNGTIEFIAIPGAPDWIDIRGNPIDIKDDFGVGQSDFPESTDDVPEGSTNLYYTEARVSANTDVAANTAARHTHTKGLIYSNTPQLVTTTGTWTEYVLATALGAVALNAEQKANGRIGHDQAGKTFICTVTATVTITNVTTSEGIAIRIGKNTASIAEASSIGEISGSQAAGSALTVTVKGVVSLLDTDYVSLWYAASTAGGSISIDSIHIDIDGIEQ